MSRRSGSRTGTSRKKDQIKEISDQIKGVGGSSAGTRAPVSTSRAGRGYRSSPVGAYEMLAANPQWTVVEAADELDVSTGTISNWRRRILRADPPKPPGRPPIASENRERAASDTQLFLALNDPRAGLVRIIRRLARRRRKCSRDELFDLGIDLYQTTYTVYVDRHSNHVPLSTNGDAIVREALGEKKADTFLKELRKYFPKARKPTTEAEEPFRFEDFQMEVPACANHCRKWED
jgi:hypothetical protein